MAARDRQRKPVGPFGMRHAEPDGRPGQPGRIGRGQGRGLAAVPVDPAPEPVAERGVHQRQLGHGPRRPARSVERRPARGRRGDGPTIGPGRSRRPPGRPRRRTLDLRRRRRSRRASGRPPPASTAGSPRSSATGSGASGPSGPAGSPPRSASGSHEVFTSRTYVPSGPRAVTVRGCLAGSSESVAITSRHSCRQIGSPPRIGRNSARQWRLTSAGSGVRTLKATESGTAAPGSTVPSSPSSPSSTWIGSQASRSIPISTPERVARPLRAVQERGQRHPEGLAGDLDCQLRPRAGPRPGPAPVPSSPSPPPTSRPVALWAANPGTAPDLEDPPAGHGKLGRRDRQRSRGPRRRRQGRQGGDRPVDLDAHPDRRGPGAGNGPRPDGAAPIRPASKAIPQADFEDAPSCAHTAYDAPGSRSTSPPPASLRAEDGPSDPWSL